jgi:ferric-dicitrate binding protein FerR (iron transport regulator)
MKKKYEKDNFLAKWASGSLTKEELDAFKASKAYASFDAILKGTEALDVPEYNNEALFNKVLKKKHQQNKSKVIKLFPKWSYAVAASIVLFIGYMAFFNNTIKNTTDYGEQLAITLPDNSEVVLNAKSTITYNKKDWENNRTLTLNGEAFFKVNKGSSFTVKTKQGDVTVLGTQFTTNSRDHVFEVICYEGRVKVSHKQESKIILKGEALRYGNVTSEVWDITAKEPAWLQGESSFSNASLLQIISALEFQYNVNIKPNNVDLENIRFTGSFTHTNIKTALKSVFEPLNIVFNFEDNKTITLSKK